MESYDEGGEGEIWKQDKNNQIKHSQKYIQLQPSAKPSNFYLSSAITSQKQLEVRNQLQSTVRTIKKTVHEMARNYANINNDDENTESKRYFTF